MVNNHDDLCPHIAAMWMFLCGCKCDWSLLVKGWLQSAGLKGQNFAHSALMQKVSKFF